MPSRVSARVYQYGAGVNNEQTGAPMAIAIAPAGAAAAAAGRMIDIYGLAGRTRTRTRGGCDSFLARLTSFGGSLLIHYKQPDTRAQIGRQICSGQFVFAALLRPSDQNENENENDDDDDGEGLICFPLEPEERERTAIGCLASWTRRPEHLDKNRSARPRKKQTDRFCLFGKNFRSALDGSQLFFRLSRGL